MYELEPYATYDHEKMIRKLVTSRIERTSLPNICAISVLCETPGTWEPCHDCEYLASEANRRASCHAVICLTGACEMHKCHRSHSDVSASTDDCLLVRA